MQPPSQGMEEGGLLSHFSLLPLLLLPVFVFTISHEEAWECVKAAKACVWRLVSKYGGAQQSTNACMNINMCYNCECVRVCVREGVCIYTNTHTTSHAYIYMYIYYTCMYIYLHVFVNIYVLNHVYKHVFIFICTHFNVYTYRCMGVCICKYMCIQSIIFT